jgi:lysophospholipase L1-like esterase
MRFAAILVAFLLSSCAAAADPIDAAEHASGINLKECRMQAKAANPKPVDVALIGDSITSNWPASVLSKYFGTSAINIGVSHLKAVYISSLICNRVYPQVRPRIIVLLIGGNDVETSSPIKTVDFIRRGVEALKVLYPETKILVLGILPRGDDADNPFRKTNEEVNRGLARLADGQRVTYADVGHVLLNRDGRFLADVVRNDKEHPTPQGYEVIGAALSPLVDTGLR